MTAQKKTSLAPTPAEISAAVFAAYFLCFVAGVRLLDLIEMLARGRPASALEILKDTPNGILDVPKGVWALLLGTGGVAAGIVLSRLGRFWIPARSYGQASWLLVIIGFAITAPFVAAGDFRSGQMAVAAYTAIAILGLNLLTGYTGQGSIGHSAFIGLGAYGTAILVNQWGVNIVLAMLAGTVLAAAAGLLIGIPALRLSGPYLAIATLGLAVVFAPIVGLQELASITGGRNGLNLFGHAFGPPVDWAWLSDARWYYFLTMLSLGVAALLLYNLLNSAIGRSFRAVRDNELAAAATGVNVAMTKLLAFAISSAYAGLAGGFLFILSNRVISPETFTVLMSIEFLLAMVIGGMASIPGSLIGAFFLVYIYREGMDTFSRRTEDGSDGFLLIAGALIAAAVLLGNPWINENLRRWGQQLHERYGAIALKALRLAAIAGLAYGFTWAFREATTSIDDLVTLRGAMIGAFLIMIVLFLPTGIAGLVTRIQGLTWSEVLGLARAAILPDTPETASGASRAGRE